MSYEHVASRAWDLEWVFVFVRLFRLLVEKAWVSRDICSAEVVYELLSSSLRFTSTVRPTVEGLGAGYFDRAFSRQ